MSNATRRAALGVVILAAGTAQGQDRRPARMARSDNRQFLLRIDSGRPGRGEQGRCKATLHARGGRENRGRVWSKPLVNEVAPTHAFVSNDGRFVVTLDEFRRGGAKHALVVYGEDGALRKEFGIQELLRRDDFRHAKVRRRGVYWLDGARFAFEEQPARFVITLKWERRIVIDLEKFEVLRDAGQAEPGDAEKIPPEILALLNAKDDPQAEGGDEDLETPEELTPELLEALIAAARAAGEEVSPEMLAQLAQMLEAQKAAEPSAEPSAESQPQDAGGGVESRRVEQADVDVDVTPDIAGNSDEVGLAVPAPNPAEKVDYLGWVNEQGVVAGDDATPLFQAATESLVPWDGDRELYEAARKGDPEALRSPEISAWLEANSTALADFRAGSQREFRSWRFESEDGSLLQARLPMLAPLRQLTKTSLIQGKQLELDGKLEQAHEIYLDTLAGGAVTGQGPTLIENLVGIAMQGLATGALLDSFSGSAADQIDFVGLSERLDEGIAAPRPFAESVQFERAMVMDVLQRVYDYDADAGRYYVSPEGLEYANNVFGMVGGDVTDGAALEAALGGRGYENTVRDLNDYYDRLTNAVAAPFPQAREGLAELEAELANPEYRARNPIVGNLAPALSRAYTLSTRSESSRRATTLVTNIMAYRQEHGSLPESLDAFGDREFLVDPFSNRRFVYRREGDGFKLYSAGPNGADDGGVHDPRTQTNDLVYWPRPGGN